MLILLIVYLCDLLLLFTTSVAGQQQLQIQTFDITIGRERRVLTGFCILFVRLGDF